MKIKNDEVAVIYRTHYWNRDTQYLARRLRGQSMEFPFYIICDESNGELNVAPFEKITHTNDASSLGLVPKRGHKPTLWNDGDFVFFYAWQSLPKTKYFFVIENDCAINFDIKEILKMIVDNNISLAGHIYDFRVGDWPEKTIAPYYNKRKQMFFPFVMMTRDLVEALYIERVRIMRLHEIDPEKYVWPYCEAIISSFVADNSRKFKYMNIEEFCDVSRFSMRPHYYMHSGVANIPKTIIHPVSGIDFLEKRLDFLGCDEIFNRNSDLMNCLSYLDPKFFLPIVYKHVVAMKSSEKIDSFWAIAKQNNWIDRIPAKNLAFGKSANQSSTCVDSSCRDTKENADIVVTASNYTTDGNHTEIEENPWWQVDFEHKETYKTIVIYVRPFLSERMNKFILSKSDDGVNWTNIYIKNDNYPVFSDEKSGFVVNLDKEERSRFIRFTGVGVTAIHLRFFEVFR